MKKRLGALLCSILLLTNFFSTSILGATIEGTDYAPSIEASGEDGDVLNAEPDSTLR